MNIIHEINTELASDLAILDKIITQAITCETELIEAISLYLINAGGKRLRPLLTLISAKLFSYSGIFHINLAAAVEFIHTATLLHDDVVDESTVRRSIPTANVIWSSKASILVGDFLFSQAFVHMVKGNSITALQSLAKAAAMITEGEVMQLTHLNQIDMSEAEYFKVITHKTAELFATSCEIGAIISDQSVSAITVMQEYGRDFGLIFQLVDDLLDYFASSLETGKNLGQDFKEGKITLPVIYAITAANSAEKNFWQRTMVKLQQEPTDFAIAIGLMQKYNVEAQVFKHIERLRKQILTNLDKLELDNIYKDYLRRLIEFIIQRRN